MNCLEFRRAAGADPQHLSDAARAHQAGCPQCAAHWQELLALDRKLLAALRVPAPAEPVAGTKPSPRQAVARAVGISPRRWYALAASVAGGVIVGSLLWASGARSALARDAVAHLGHEPSAMRVNHVPADPGRVKDVLAEEGVRLRSDPGMVTYVMSCSFRGHKVPHLVVQTDRGPVTVLVLRDEKVRREMRFHEQGYSGTIEPSGPGSLAIIGTDDVQVRQAAARVAAAVDWIG